MTTHGKFENRLNYETHESGAVENGVLKSAQNIRNGGNDQSSPGRAYVSQRNQLSCRYVWVTQRDDDM